jgi:hypothetical protein
MTLAMIDEEAFEFFNQGLDAALVIELSEPTSQVASYVINQVASPSAKITNMSMDVEVIEKEDEDEEDETYRQLTEAEWKRVVLRTPVLRMRGLGSDRIFEHSAPDGATFTIRDLVAAIVETERQSRQESEWLGGIDAHHVHFAGMNCDENGVWNIDWDS